MKELIAKGKWWLPNNPQKKVFGILKIIPDLKTTLDVMDDEPIDISERPNFYGDILGLKPKIIIGETISSTIPLDRQITLFDCTIKGGMMRDQGGVYNTIYEVSTVFNGVHFLSPNKIKFNIINLECSGLHEWLNISMFKQEYVKSGNMRHILKYSSPKEILLTKTKNLEINLILQVIQKLTTFQSRYCIGGSEVICKQIAPIGIIFKEMETFHNCLNTINHLRNFLTLLIFKSIHILSMNGFNEIVIGGGEIFNRTVEDIQPPRSLDMSDILIPYEDIKEKISEMLKNWLDNAKALQPVCDFYFNTFSDQNIAPETKFLQLIIAIEAYQSNFVNIERKKIPTSKFRRLKEKLKAQCPNPDDKEFIEEKLSNKITLGEELEELLKNLNVITKRFIPEDEIGDFIKKVTKTRNYLIHHTKELELQIATEKELVRINQQLKLLLLVCLLKETGLKLDFIKSLLEKSQRFLFEMRIIWPG